MSTGNIAFFWTLFEGAWHWDISYAWSCATGTAAISQLNYSCYRSSRSTVSVPSIAPPFLAIWPPPRQVLFDQYLANIPAIDQNRAKFAAIAALISQQHQFPWPGIE